MVKFDTVVSSGGGVKGLYTLGVLHYYYENGDYDPSFVDTYAGTSVGSAISLLLVVGYSPMEIFQELYSMDSFFEVADKKKSFLDIIKNVFKKMGLFTIDALIGKVDKMVIQKLGLSSAPTLKELYDITGKKLICVATNVTKKRAEYFNYIDFPNLKCTNAVKMSCNIPFMFQKIKYKGCIYVDGGIVNNIPVDYVNNGKNKILGILIQDSSGTSSPDEMGGYVSCMVFATTREMNKARIRVVGDNLTLVDITKLAENTSLVQMTIPREDKMTMFLGGFEKAKEVNKTEYLYIPGWEYKSEGNLHDKLYILTQPQLDKLINEEISKRAQLKLKIKDEEIKEWGNDGWEDWSDIESLED